MLTPLIARLVDAVPPAWRAAMLYELREDMEIVMYCRSEFGVLADAVCVLTDRGRRPIRLHDGMLEWRLSDLPLDESVLT